MVCVEAEKQWVVRNLVSSSATNQRFGYRKLSLEMRITPPSEQPFLKGQGPQKKKQST